MSKNFNELEVILSEFNDIYDVIVLTETWVISNENLFNLKSYTKIYNKGTVNKNDGVMVYVKNRYKSEAKIVNI